MSLLQIVKGDFTLGRKVDDVEITWRRPLWPRHGTTVGLEVVGDAANLYDVHPGTYLIVREDRIPAWGVDHPPIYRVEESPWDSDARIPTIAVKAAPLAAYIGREPVAPLGGVVDFGTDETHDTVTDVPAETAIKHYWENYAGPSADVTRQWPDLVIEPDQGRGDDVTVTARGQSITEVCTVPGVQAGVGWEVVYRLAERDIMLRTVHGQTRDRVVFDPTKRDNASRLELVENDRPPNVAFVLGAGEGADRIMAVVHLGTTMPTPPDRRAIVIEATDVETVPELRGRAGRELRAANAEFTSTDRARVEIDPLGKLPYRVKWDRGDLVTVRSTARDYSQQLRVVDVEASDGRSGLTAKAEIGMPWPSAEALREMQEGLSSDHR